MQMASVFSYVLPVSLAHIHDSSYYKKPLVPTQISYQKQEDFILDLSNRYLHFSYRISYKFLSGGAFIKPHLNFAAILPLKLRQKFHRTVIGAKNLRVDFCISNLIL